MLDFSWGEVMLIGGVALVVIGPKELPKALRTLGQVTSKVRRMASEFHAQFNEAMREAELDEVKRDVEGINRSVSSTLATGFNPIQTIRDEIKGAVESQPKSSETKPFEAKPSSEDLADATAQLEAERREETPALPPPDLPELVPAEPVAVVPGALTPPEPLALVSQGVSASETSLPVAHKAPRTGTGP